MQYIINAGWRLKGLQGKFSSQLPFLNEDLHCHSWSLKDLKWLLNNEHKDFTASAISLPDMF